MEMEIRRLPEGTDKVTALAELVYKYAGNLAEINGADTGEKLAFWLETSMKRRQIEVLLKAVAKCMLDKPSTTDNEDDVIIVESTNDEPAPSTSTSQSADSSTSNQKKNDSVLSNSDKGIDNQQTPVTSSTIDSSTSVTSKLSSNGVCKNKSDNNLNQKNINDKSKDDGLERDITNKGGPNQSTNNEDDIKGKKEECEKDPSSDKVSLVKKGTDLDYEVIYLDDVNDLVNDKAEVVIADDNTPAENDKSEDYFDMDCDEIDENPAEAEEEVQNTRESTIVVDPIDEEVQNKGDSSIVIHSIVEEVKKTKKTSVVDSIDEPDVMIIDDEDEKEKEVKTKDKSPEQVHLNNSKNVPQKEHLEHKQLEKAIVKEVVVTTSTISEKADLPSGKIEVDMVPKLEEVEIIDIDSDSDDIKVKKEDMSPEKKPEEPVKPVSIVGFFTNKAKFAEDKLKSSQKVNESGGGSEVTILSNPEEQPATSYDDTAKDNHENGEDEDEIKNMNALGLIPIKKGEIPAKYLARMDTAVTTTSNKRSFADLVGYFEDHSSCRMTEKEGSCSPKTKKRLLDFDKKWHMVPKYSPDQDKYLARPGGIEANIYNADVTQHVMPAVNHMRGTEFRKPGLYTSFSSCAPNVVIETVNSNTPMNFNCHQSYSHSYNGYANVHNGKLEESDLHHSSKSQQRSRLNFKNNSMHSAKLMKAKKNLKKSLKGNDESEQSESETDQYSDSDKRKTRKSGKLLNSGKKRGSSQVHRGNVSRLVGRGRGYQRGFGKSSERGSSLRLNVPSKSSQRGRGSIRASVTSSRGSFRGSIRGKGPQRKNISRDSVKQTSSSSDSDTSDSDSSDSDSSDSDSDSSDDDRIRGRNVKSKNNSTRGSVRGRGSRGSLRGRGFKRGSYANGLLNAAKHKAKLKKKPDLKKSNVAKNSKLNKPQPSGQKTTNSNLRSRTVSKTNAAINKASSVTNKTKKTNANIVSKQLAVCLLRTSSYGKKKSLTDTPKAAKPVKSNVKMPDSKSKKDQTKKITFTKVKQSNNQAKKSKNTKTKKVSDKNESEDESDIIVLD